jgi:DNA polymerase-3 subunit gamma/tau
MNQCDVNYRQSSNKRLLVELTLIEIAQLTQPDEGGASSGRKPRRLKSLFRQMIQQTQPEVKSAQQVAAVEEKLEEKKETQGGEHKVEVGERIAESAPQVATPRLKVSQIGMSWKNLRQQAKPKMQILPGTAGVETTKKEEGEVFSQEDLELQWMSMCNRMPQRLSGIAARMKNMNPVIKELPAVEVVVPNEIIKAEMEQIRGSILATLKIYLHNSNITLTLRVAEKQEQAKILSRREQFEEMTKANPSVEKLRKEFDLELA